MFLKLDDIYVNVLHIKSIAITNSSVRKNYYYVVATMHDLRNIEGYCTIEDFDKKIKKD